MAEGFKPIPVTLAPTCVSVIFWVLLGSGGGEAVAQAPSHSGISNPSIFHFLFFTGEIICNPLLCCRVRALDSKSSVGRGHLGGQGGSLVVCSLLGQGLVGGVEAYRLTGGQRQQHNPYGHAPVLQSRDQHPSTFRATEN